MKRLWLFLQDNLWIVALPAFIVVLVGCGQLISLPPPNDVWSKSAGSAFVSIDGETRLIASAVCNIAPDPKHHLTENDRYLTVECREAHLGYNAISREWNLILGRTVFSGTGSSIWFQNDNNTKGEK